MAIPRICGFCGKVVTGRCACQIARHKVAKARSDKRRPGSSARGYNRAWENYRAKFLKANPRCTRCKAPASVVDHKTPHKGDRRLFADPRNHVALCGPCHNSWKQSIERRQSA